MSYVDLKHVLADLALEAVAHPDRATWAAVAAAYGEIASDDHLRIPWKILHTRASQIADPLGWRVRPQDATYLVDRGVLTRRDATYTLKSQYGSYLGYFRQQTSRLLEALRFLTTSGRASGELQLGLALFNAGLFFECHELLEGLWKATSGPDKAFYHGVVQVAAAFYHYEKHNRHGAVTLLTKGRDKLATYPSSYLGVDVAVFRRSLEPWAVAFEAQAEDKRPQTFPHIVFAMS
jgi:DUF309 family protein family protein